MAICSHIYVRLTIYTCCIYIYIYICMHLNAPVCMLIYAYMLLSMCIEAYIGVVLLVFESCPILLLPLTRRFAHNSK